MNLNRSEDFDGGGRILSPYFVDRLSSMKRQFNTCFEWCAGPGYIGRAVLEDNICENLVLADISKESLVYGMETYGHSSSIKCYRSDNMKQIPRELLGKIDLVVANPPSYFNIQSDHPLGERMGCDLRANDRGWQIHKDFYLNIEPFLTDDAVLLIHEVAVFDKEFYLQDEEVPYDLRDNSPIIDFYEMIKSGNLTLSDVSVSSEDIMGYFLTILNGRHMYAL